MQRISAKHRALGRSVVELDARGPQLLGGILGPVLSPILGGGAAPTTSPSNPQPSPSPSPTPAANGPVPSSGGGGGAAPSAGSTTPNSGSGGGASPPASASPASGGGSGLTPSPLPSPNSPAPASSVSSSGSIAPSSTGSSGASTGGGGSLGTGSSSNAPVNVAPVPSTATHVGAATSTPSPAAGLAVSSQLPQAVSGSNTMAIAPSATFTAAAAASTSSQLSGGAIAGIVIVCLLALLGLTLLIARRRSIARRMELRKQWFFEPRNSSGNFSFISNPRNPLASSGVAEGSRNSARSSFATNFDQGLMFRVDSPLGSGALDVPEFPPMAEVRDRNSALISTGGAVTRRESMNSMLSNGSDSGAQYLSVPTGHKTEPASPMSVRPFSPSESFAFPKPPVPTSPQSPPSTADSFYLAGGQATVSSQSSAATLVHLSSPPRALISDDLPPTPGSSSHPNQPGPTGASSLAAFVANPDPFVDPAKPEFAAVEIIRRPFTPTLDDELAVFPGDRVRVLQVFDDGWAFVEKLASIEFDRNERGLIPVDCLREAGQALPVFLAQKRVSSYEASGVTLTTD